MNPIVLDTDVVSFLLKSDTRVQIYLPHLDDRQWLISFMTEAELEKWALLANLSNKRIEWLRRAGRRIETADAWIAATALIYDAPLLTHNRSDYLGVPGLQFGA